MFYRFFLLLVLHFIITFSLLGQDSIGLSEYEVVVSEINELNKAGKYKAAIKFAENAIETSSINCQNKLGLYRKIGVSYYLEDDFDNALRYWKDTIINKWDFCKVSAVQKIKVYSNISAVYDYIDEMDLYFEYFEKVLELNNSLEKIDTFTTIQNYIRAGTYFSSVSDFTKAKTYFDQAILFFNDGYVSPESLALLYNRYGFAALENGQYRESLSYFELALAKQPKAFSDDIETAFAIYFNMSIAHLKLLNLKEAEFYFRKAKLLTTNNDTLGQRVSVLRLEAEILFTKDDDSDYLSLLFDEIISLTIILGKADDLAIAYGNKAEFLLRKNSLMVADSMIKLGFEAILGQDFDVLSNNQTFSRQAILNPEPLLWLYSVSVLLKDAQFFRSKNSSFLVQSLAYTEKLDQLVKQSRVEIGTKQSSINSLKKVYPALERGIEVAMKLSTITGDKAYLEKAYSLATRNKAIVLRENLIKADFQKRLLPEDVLLQLKEYQRNLTNLKVEIQGQANIYEKDSLSKLFFNKIEDLDYYYSTLKDNHPKYFEIDSELSNEINLNQIQNKLDEGQAILEYFMGDRQLYSFLITEDGIDVMVTKLDSIFISQINNEISEQRSSSRKEEQSRVYRKLIYPFLDILTVKDISRLIIIPDGYLGALSFEALSIGDGNYLIEDFAISYSYSNTFLLNNSSIEKTSAEYIGYGTKYSNSIDGNIKKYYPLLSTFQLGNLTNSEDEIIGSSKLFDSRTFLNKDANKSEFVKGINSAQIIHLALHGISYGKNNENSGVLFDDEMSNSFVLNTEEIYNLNLRTSLLILSVCQSAEGEIFRGEGIQSMSRAFFAAGSPSIVSSLWTASEKPTAEILSVFLSEIKSGLPKDLALQKAKLNYLSNAKPSLMNEKYWANLILIGSAESLTFTSTSKKYYIFIMILFTLLISYLLKRRFDFRKAE